MIVDLDFNLAAWVKKIQIEADSEEEAINKLMGMTIEEMVNEGATFGSDLKITEIDSFISQYDVTVEVSDIEYDFTDENIDPAVVEYLLNILPTVKTITVRGITPDDDLEEAIKDELEYITDHGVSSFKFKIIDKK